VGEWQDGVTGDSVLLCSGGLDSTTLAYLLVSHGKRFVPLFLDYGQHCARTEYARLGTVLPEVVRRAIVSLDISAVYRGSRSRLVAEADLWREEVQDEDLYLPYRNLLMLSVGAAFAQVHGMDAVYAAFINSNHAREIDCSAAFFGRLAELLAVYGAVRVEMPFRDMSKLDVARLGLSLGAPVAATYSCQVSSKIPCGACPNCVERLDALAVLEAEAADEGVL
jgi:7-cyano-7-deazaguanine synthase